MKKLTKVVNIYPSGAIVGVNPPIRSVVKRVTKSIDEIRTCLMARATVEEILSDGSVVKLNISNYDKCLDPNKVSKSCNCGCGGTSCWKTTGTSTIPEGKTTWQAAYDKALEGLDLAGMSRKQRRSVLANAKLTADAATRNNAVEEEVVMGVASIETVEDATEETVVEEAVEVVEETVAEESVEEVVVTNDAEDLTGIVE